jgi:hypothetical protein
MRITPRPVLVAAALGLAAGLTAVTMQAATASSAEDHGDRANAYEIGLFGDMPYGDVGRSQFPNVIADMNAHDLAFNAFDGDIKNGKERCDQWQYDQAATNFASFEAPTIYIPGDNEWTDCDRASNGSYDPNERLALVRRMFDQTPNSLGKHTISLVRQSAEYPENVRWERGGVTYIGLNVPGSDNNAPQFDTAGHQIDGDATEYAARNAANLAWLKDSFDAASAAKSIAVMVVIQADMWSTADPTAHFADTKRELARQAIDFGRQVVLVNGDSHVFREDKPLTDALGVPLQNFTRVQTFGSDQNHWVSATVDPRPRDGEEVFTFHQRVVTANVPAYVRP